MTIQEQIMAQRQKAGLHLTFRIPDRNDLFVCYPATEAAKAEWLVKAEKLGWLQIKPQQPSCDVGLFGDRSQMDLQDRKDV